MKTLDDLLSEYTDSIDSTDSGSTDSGSTDSVYTDVDQASSEPQESTNQEEKQPLIPQDWTNFDEEEFQEWYAGWADETGINKDPDYPGHFYDYRAAYKAGAFPEQGEDGVYHWPSEFKLPGHPRLVIDGVDTRTMTPVTQYIPQQESVSQEPTISDQKSQESKTTPIATPTYLEAGGQAEAAAGQMMGQGLLKVLGWDNSETTPFGAKSFEQAGRLALRALPEMASALIDLFVLSPEGSASAELGNQALRSVSPAIGALVESPLVKAAKLAVAPEAREAVRLMNKAFPKALKRPNASIAEQILTAPAGFLAPMAASAVSPATGFAMTFFTSYGHALEELEDQNVEDQRARDTALFIAASTTPVEFAGNLLQIKPILSALKFAAKPVSQAATSLFKEIATGAVGEGVEEFIQTYFEIAGMYYAANPEMNPVDIAKYIFETFDKQTMEALKAGGLGAVSGLLLTGGGTLSAQALGEFRLHHQEEKKNKLFSKIENTLNLKPGTVSAGVATGKTLDQILDEAETSKIEEEVLSKPEGVLREMGGLSGEVVEEEVGKQEAGRPVTRGHKPKTVDVLEKTEWFSTTVEAEEAGKTATEKDISDWEKAKNELTDRGNWFIETGQLKEGKEMMLQVRRLGRAIELGRQVQDKERTKAPIELFHGTNAEFKDEEIETDKRMFGIHLTTSEDVAKTYGTVKKYELAKGSKVLDLSDLETDALYRFMKDQGILEKEDLEDEDLKRYIQNGQLFQYDISNKTHLADDVAKTAKSLGYDVVKMPDELGKGSDNVAYVVVNKKSLRPPRPKISQKEKESLRLEKVTIQVRGLPNLETNVQVNPTTSQTVGFLKRSKEGILRGVISKDGDLYLWDAYDSTHDAFLDSAGLAVSQVTSPELGWRWQNYFLVANPEDINRAEIDIPEWRGRVTTPQETIERWQKKRKLIQDRKAQEEPRKETSEPSLEKTEPSVSKPESEVSKRVADWELEQGTGELFSFRNETHRNWLKSLGYTEEQIHEAEFFARISARQKLRGVKLREPKAQKEEEGKVSPLVETGESPLLGGRGAVRDAAKTDGQIAKAERMEKDGKSRKEIWKATGWVRGPGGQWRFEIDDSNAKITSPGKPKSQKATEEEKGWRWRATVPISLLSESSQASSSGRVENEPVDHIDWSSPVKLSDVLIHTELYKFYPKLKDLRVVVDPSLKDGAYFEGEEWTIGIADAQFLSSKDLVESIFHEVQHAIQFLEGFPQGTSPKIEFEKLLHSKESAGFSVSELWNLAIERYQNSAGEAESLDTVGRLVYSTSKRKKIPPYTWAEDALGMPMKTWIVRASGQSTSFQIDTHRAISSTMWDLIHTGERINKYADLLKETAEEIGLDKFPELMNHIEVVLQNKISLDPSRIREESITSYMKRTGATRDEIEQRILDGRIRGTFSLLEPLHGLMRLSLSLNKSDVEFKRTVYHESWHMIEKWFFTADEMKVLEEWEPDHEKRADAFAEYIQRKLQNKPESWITEVWDRIIWFLRTLRRKLLNQGVTNLDDLFEWVRHGSVKPKRFQAMLEYQKERGLPTEIKLRNALSEVRSGTGATIIPMTLVGEPPDTQENAKKQIKVMVEGWGQQNPREVIPSLYGAYDVTLNPKFKEWFNGSVVTETGEVGGEPLIVYHGTNAKFSQFHPLSHFGTYTAATERLKSISPPQSGESVMPVFLSIKNPVTIIDYGQHFVEDVDRVASDLYKEGILTREEEVSIFDSDGSEKLKNLVSALSELGYDGFRYINRVEDEGSDSWVPFSPKQVKSIFNRGTWSRRSGNISISLDEEKGATTETGVSLSLEGSGWTPEKGRADVGDEDRSLPHIIELPEIVTLYKMLMDGKVPQIRELLLKDERVRSVFLPGRGIVRLKADLFKDSELASRVLAHEIGRIVDWLPDYSLRGTLLGKISGLKDWMQKTLPFKPGAPGELTEEDRIRLREEAIKLLGVTQKLRTTWIDTTTTETIGVSPEDVLAIWNAVEKAKLLSPELYQYVVGLDTNAKKLIVKAALKGQVADELKQFVKTVKVGPTTKKQVTEIIEIPPTQEEIARKLAELINEEIRKRRLWVAEEVRDELKALSARWRPWNPSTASKRERRLRSSAAELYADAISVLINDPQFLKAQAPKFYEAFFNYINNKPEFKKAYLEIQRTIHAGEVEKLRVTNFFQMVDKGNDLYGLQYKVGKLSLRDDAARAVVDAFHFVIKDVKKVGEENIPDHLNPRYKLEEMVYTPSEIEALLTVLYRNVINRLQKAGLEWDREFALLTYLMRVAFDPTMKNKAHPQGWSSENALEKLAAMKEHELRPEQWKALTDAAKALREIHETFVIDKSEALEIWDQETINRFRDNDTYATWDVQSYLEKRYGRSVALRVFPVIGTLADITNPATATVMRDVAFIKAANRNIAARTLVKFYQDYSNILGVDVREAPTKWNSTLKVHEIQEPPAGSMLGLVSYIHKGKAYGYWLPETIAETIHKSPVRATFIARVLRGLTNPMRQIFTDLNYGFWIVNAFFRDAQRYFMDLPGWRIADFAKHWAKGLKPAFKSVFAIPDDVVQEMQRDNMLISVTDMRDLADEDKQIERLLKLYHIKGPEQFNNRIIKPWGQLFNYITNRLRLGQFYFESIGRGLERTTKIAAYTYLTQNFPDLSKETIGHLVRTRGGSPDFWRAGREHSILNNLLMFMNAQKEGYRGDWEAFKDNPGEFLSKKLLFIVGPKLLMYAGVLGLLGPAIKDILDGVSEYDLTNYLIVPLGLTSSGKSVYWRTPTDEFSRLLGGVLWKVMRTLPIPTTSGRDESIALGEGITHLMDYAAGQVPTVSPIISVMMDVIEYASGQNPYDSFYGRHAIGEVEFRAKDERARNQMLQYVLSKLGASIVYKFKHDKVEKVAEELENIIGFPVSSDVADFMIKLPDKPILSNVLGRFLKVSNYGVRERLLRLKDKVKTENARTILDAREAAWAIVDGKTPTAEQLVALFQKPDVVDRQMMLGLARKYGMVYFEEWVASSSKDEKNAIIQELLLKQGLPKQDANVAAPPPESGDQVVPKSSSTEDKLPPLGLMKLMEQ